MTQLAAVVLFTGVVLYAMFGGADFGAGFWDLTAGGARRGRRPRALIDSSLGPVWEANHVWLIFCLVVMWTSFPTAFVAIMTTLYIPLWMAAVGIVIRGSGFAFRKVAVRTAEQRVTGAAFALSSLITPFFLGTVAGGIASGRAPATGSGDAVTSWVNPTSLLGGVLAVVVCAYLAAVFLTADARSHASPDLEEWFRARAIAAAVVAGVLSVGGVVILRSDAHRLFERLVGPALPLLVLAVAAGGAALVLLRRLDPRRLRILAALAVAAVISGWGVAQYPYLLGTHLRLSEAAAPNATLAAIAVIFAAALALCVPSIVLLFVLQQRGVVEGSWEASRRSPSPGARTRGLD